MSCAFKTLSQWPIHIERLTTMKKRPKISKEVSKSLVDQLNDRMAEIAVIDCVSGGEPFYLLNGGKPGVEYWTPQAEKVRQLYKMAHPVTYVFAKIMNYLAGGE
jgi:hypothetical protein